VAAPENNGRASEFCFFAARINRGWVRAFFWGGAAHGPRSSSRLTPFVVPASGSFLVVLGVSASALGVAFLFLF
jgi:hypothetical protein